MNNDIEALIAAVRRKTIEECAKVCDEQRLKYKGGAPDYQTGTIDCAEALRGLNAC